MQRYLHSFEADTDHIGSSVPSLCGFLIHLAQEIGVALGQCAELNRFLMNAAVLIPPSYSDTKLHINMGTDDSQISKAKTSN